ncbi:uncharacterized protein [Prorops nasuta]|uniref:uncharacterized protein n=1 Tax=Prorops nasuta TaxID=863751 RepID=UPI0034CEB80B
MMAIRILRMDVLQNRGILMNIIKNIKQTSANVNAVGIGKYDFVEKYDLTLPFKSPVQFQLFDQRLKEDSEYRQEFKNSLPFYLDARNNVTKSITNIMKAFMNREVAIGFTAVKPQASKKVLKHTEFCKCMLDAVIRYHTDEYGGPITEKYVYKCIGTTLNNSKDWSRRVT